MAITAFILLVSRLLDAETSTNFIGYMANFGVVIMFGAPINDYISGNQDSERVMSGLSVSLAWLLVGIQLWDFFVITPNAIGTVINIALLLLPRSTGHEYLPLEDR